MAEHPVFSVTVDLVVLTIRDGALQRAAGPPGRSPPYRGGWALPGGFVAARRGPRRRRRPRAGRGDRARPAPAGHLEQLATLRRAPAATRAGGWSPWPTWPCCPTCRPRWPASDAAGGRLASGRPRRPAARLRPRPDPRRRPGTGPGEAGVHPAGHRVLPARVHRRRAARGLRGGLGRAAGPAQLPPQGDRHRGFVEPVGALDRRRPGPPGPAVPARRPADHLHPPLLRGHPVSDPDSRTLAA